MPVLGSKNVPVDKINLRLILVSGKTREYLFSPSESAGDIAQFVFDNWPAEWEEEAVSFINWYQALARFLFCNGLYGLRYLNQVSHRKTCSQESCRVFFV